MDKKSEERLIIDYFRELLADFPKGKLIQSESPDFIIKTGSKRSIGIELTRLDHNAFSLKEKIEASLEKKNAKIALYQQKKFNAIWLIIHVDFIDVSKSFNIKNKLENWKFNSKFDKVLLFDLFEKKIFAINV